MVLEAKQILSDINTAVVQHNQNDIRTHLGMSEIGYSCQKRIWLSWRWATFKTHSGRLLRLFNRGHREEPSLISFLRWAGYLVLDVDPATGEQYKVGEGHFLGHTDGKLIPVHLKKYVEYLLEFKTHNKSSHQQLVRANSVKVAKYTHYVQMQIYMAKQGLEYAVYIAVCKDNDNLYIEIVKFNKAVAIKYSRRAKYLIGCVKPPQGISTSDTYWECKMCDYYNVCHCGVSVAKSCRTCTESSPRDNGYWYCENKLLSVQQQLNACKKYVNCCT